MTTYKLFKMKNGKLYPLYVEAKREMPIGQWLTAQIGELADDTHVKSKLGSLALRPGFHSTTIPFTDWIGKRKDDGTLIQKKDTVWCECEVSGKEVIVPDRYGSRHLLQGWYRFKTNAKQKEPWIISNKIKIKRVLSNNEVREICNKHGIKAQEVESNG